MSRIARLRPVITSLAAVLAAALVVGACGAGQLAPTSQQVATIDGANVDAGDIAVRDAQIVFSGPVTAPQAYPVGASAPLAMVIANDGAVADRLVSASSPVARTVTLDGVLDVPAGRALVVTGEPAPEPAAQPDGESPDGEEPTATPTADPEAEADAAAPVTPTAVPGAGERIARIVLTGLREPIRAGMSYEVVLVFEQAGEVRVPVPLQVPDGPRVDDPDR